MQSMESNKKRKEKGEKRICADIDKGEWKEYFIKLLRGVEHKVVRGGRRKRKRKNVEKHIAREEIRRAIGKPKDAKAVGINGIPSEVWKYKRE